LAVLFCITCPLANPPLFPYTTLFRSVVTADPATTLRALVESGKQRSFGKKVIAPKTMTQRRYVDAIERYDLVFGVGPAGTGKTRSEEHTSELQSRENLVCRLLLEKKN